MATLKDGSTAVTAAGPTQPEARMNACVLLLERLGAQPEAPVGVTLRMC